MSGHEALEAVGALSDEVLEQRVSLLSRRESSTTASLLVHLSEFDVRRLHRAHAHPSLFSYCLRHLHFSEHAAYDRIAAARAARRFPVLLDEVAAGTLHLTAVVLLAPHLTESDHLAIIHAARHQTRRGIEQLIATYRPMPPVADMVRRLPVARLPTVGTVPVPGSVSISAPVPGDATPSERAEAPSERTAAGSSEGVPFAVQNGKPEGRESPRWSEASVPPVGTPGAAPSRSVIAPLSPERYRVQFTADADLRDKLRRAQDLLRHQIPDGDLARLFDRALTVLLEQVERNRLGAGFQRAARGGGGGDGGGGGGGGGGGNSVEALEESARSRYISTLVRREVWRRDGARCAFRSEDDARCAETRFLEFHHVVPYARGGASSVGNIELRCRTHNQLESERTYGQRVAAHRMAAQRKTEQRETEQRVNEQQATEQRPTERRTTGQRMTGQGVTEQRVTGQGVTGQGVTGRRGPPAAPQAPPGDDG